MRGMTITYRVKNGIYVNLTNRCPCACTFCLRTHADGVYGSDSLWLEREPTVEEVCESLEKWDMSEIEEIVFCGYGEPTERLDALCEVARVIKKRWDIPVRVNTNGLSDLINGRSTAEDFEGIIDTVSVSLNTPDEKEYLETVRPKFGEGSFDAMLSFTRECTKYVPRVCMTIVGEPITSLPAQEKCRAICTSLGAQLRVRPYEE